VVDFGELLPNLRRCTTNCSGRLNQATRFSNHARCGSVTGGTAGCDVGHNCKWLELCAGNGPTDTVPARMLHEHWSSSTVGAQGSKAPPGEATQEENRSGCPQ